MFLSYLPGSYCTVTSLLTPHKHFTTNVCLEYWLIYGYNTVRWLFHIWLFTRYSQCVCLRNPSGQKLLDIFGFLNGNDYFFVKRRLFSLPYCYVLLKLVSCCLREISCSIRCWWSYIWKQAQPAQIRMSHGCTFRHGLMSITNIHSQLLNTPVLITNLSGVLVLRGFLSNFLHIAWHLHVS